jgi:spermidine/putrescine transport system substrate-binding protein
MTDRSDLERLIAQDAAARWSRRRFLGRMGATAGLAVLGPSVLAACGSDNKSSSATGTSGKPTSSDTLRISNWPLYMAPGFVKAFEQESGLKVNYKEDFNDNEQWFAKYSTTLQHKQDVGADLVVPTEFLAGRLHSLNWLAQIEESAVPNKKNMRPDLADSVVDPGRKYTMPYMSGMVGLAYNKKLAGREIKSMDDVWDPQFKGRVSLFSDVRDGLGMIMLSQGNDPAKVTAKTIQQAIDKVAEEKSKGQIRKFTGNDYADDLSAGNVVIAQAYSGDVVQLHADNPDLQFVVPEAGGTRFVDCMVIPYTTKNQKGAETWMNYIYDRKNYAKLDIVVQYVPVLSDMTDELSKLDPKVASNPLINPTPETLAMLHDFPVLTDVQEQAFSKAYTKVTGS